jgi:hypothetical protein
MHQIALYLLSWTSAQRQQTISILDASSKAVLNSQAFSNFSHGEYAVWNVQGHVLIQVQVVSANAIVNGIFFDPPK